MKLNATVIEIAPATDYVIIRFQLSSYDGNATSGDAFSVAVASADGYELGQTPVIEI